MLTTSQPSSTRCLTIQYPALPVPPVTMTRFLAMPNDPPPPLDRQQTKRAAPAGTAPSGWNARGSGAPRPNKTTSAALAKTASSSLRQPRPPSPVDPELDAGQPLVVVETDVRAVRRQDRVGVRD